MFATVLENGFQEFEQRSRSPEAYRYHRDYFVRLWGDRKAAEVTTDEIEQWKLRRLKEVRPGTVQSQLAYLSLCFRIAVRKGTLEANPVSGVDWPRVFHDRCRYLEEDEEDRLQAAMLPADYSIVRFAILTGMRRVEQFKLEPGDINQATSFARIKLGKNGRPRRVPLTPEALGIARAWIDTLEAPWVFGPEPDRVKAGKDFYRQVFRPAVRLAGIPDFTWRDLRHTAASRMVMAGVELYRVQKILGHTNPLQTQRYAHLSDEELHDSVGKIW